jgi:hypothetical protein
VQRSNRLKSFTAAVNGLWALPTLHFYYYKLVVTHLNYQAAQEWLFEDEYERVNGQILAEEVM